MPKQSLKTWLWLVFAVAACCISWSYMHRVLLPWEFYVNVTRGHVRTQMGDLYPRWIGTRELLLHGKNPYSLEVSHEIQMAFYGHPIEQSYDKPQFEIIDEQRFAYPIYVVVLLAPTIHADFDQLQTWDPVLLAILIGVSVWLWMGVLQWNPPLPMIVALALFVLSSPQLGQGLRLRQLGLLVAFLLALAAWLVTRQRYFMAGVLLAVSTIKPQMIALCMIWFVIWAFGDWKKRWPLAAGFGTCLGLLFGIGEWLLPSWPRDFVEGLEAYGKYFPSTSPLRLILGNWIGGSLSVLLVALLLIYSWRKRRVYANGPEFAQVLAVYLIASTLILPLLTPYNQVLLFLPVFMIFRDWNKLPRTARIAFLGLVLWPWLVQLVFLFHSPRLDSMNRLPLLPAVLAILFPFVVPLLLYVRRRQISYLPA